MPNAARLLARSKAALDRYNKTYKDLDGTAKNADYAEAVLHTGDNINGSTDPADYDENGAMLKGLKRVKV